MNKILHISQLIGGLDIYIRNSIIYSNLENEFIIVRGKGDDSKPIIKNNKEIREYKVNLYRKINLIEDLKCLIQILKIIQHEKPNIIHCHSAKGGLLGRIAGFLTNTKTYYTPHAFSFLAFEKKIFRTIFLITERYLKFNAYLLACSASEREIGIKNVHYSPKKAYVWNNSVPDASNLFSKGSSNIKTSYVSYVGRPSYQKNTLFLIDVIYNVVKYIPNFKMYLLGVGFYSPDLENLKKKILELKLSTNITLIPWISQQETFSYINDSVFYLSVSRYEGLPLSVLEAMSLGKALILSEVPGNIDCVDNNRNGYLLNLDIKEFANKIIELWNNEQKRDLFAKESRKKYLNEYNIKNQILKLDKLYSL